MSKLISRNPIQRFKQGRKIVKAQSGKKVIATVDGRQVETTIEQARRNGWEYFNPSKQAEFIRNYPYYGKYATHYVMPFSKFPAFIQDAQFGDYESGWSGKSSNNESGLVFDLEYGNLAWQPKEIRVPQVPIRVPYVVPTQKPQSNSLAQNVGTQNVQPKAASPTKKRTVIKKVSTPASTPVNYGLIGGIQKGWRGQKGVIDDQSFEALQSLGYSGERNAQAAQQWINNNLSKYGIIGSSVATDNAWGEQSSRALKMMIQNKANNDLASVFPSSNPSYSTIVTKQTPSINEQAAFNAGNNHNLKFTPTIFNFNRAQTRDWLRNNGIGAYSLTGAQRRAVRNILGGKGTDQDRNLVRMDSKLQELLKSKGYFKKGGLISRNPIERFKNGGVQKFQNAGNLPTAPKAEDRYKNGRKYSAAYLGIPMNTGIPVDNTYYGESIKQVSTPNRAKIRQHILFRHSPYNNDTIYTEIPEHTKRLPILPQVYIIPRKGFSFAQTPEYEILKRRFNTAWNLAK